MKKLKENTTNTASSHRTRILTIAGAVLCCILWGSAFPAIKTGYDIWGISGTDTMSIIEFAGIRFFIAGLLVILIASVTTSKPIIMHKSDFFAVVILSLFQTIGQYVLFYVGLAHTSGVNASVMDSLTTVFAILISCLVFRLEKINFQKILGCILGFAGVLFINITGEGMRLNLLGDGLIILSAVCYGISSTLIKKYSANHDTVMLSGYQFMFGGIVMTVTGMIGRGRTGYDITSFPQAISIIIYLACVSGVAYTLWGILLKKNPVAKIAIFGFVTPIAGVILSMVFLGETTIIGWRYIVALVLITLSIVVVNYT